MLVPMRQPFARAFQSVTSPSSCCTHPSYSPSLIRSGHVPVLVVTHLSCTHTNAPRLHCAHSPHRTLGSATGGKALLRARTRTHTHTRTCFFVCVCVCIGERMRSCAHTSKPICVYMRSFFSNGEAKLKKKISMI